MPTYRSTAPDGTVTEYDAAAPDAQHLGNGWRLESIEAAYVAPDAPVLPATVYGGRRLLTRTEFVDLLGDVAYVAILSMARQSVEVEAEVVRLKITTPDANGYSVDLDSPKLQTGITLIGTLLEAQGVVASGWTEGVLNG